ncbi:transporter substrate-binding domain-containing protein [Pseudoalteromonas sp. DL2-H2.2]|uniref:transporter substrate-binding domain-containing protein n=1 Tax=Pseudoalteromonas sp. DL2-H2.2 TaxID=2908889 RepID=UPI001F355208|nr:transporter substrate-binding domain-containing protein [Pseudoalteromonas sp. DL2-H2.2]MCF2909218.1 transporter substrate-binding domain-containing protein [Pseudoalteromonas sp. DL2-H2.2]
MKINLLTVSLMWLVFSAVNLVHAAERLNIYVYHNKPPYITNQTEQRGLYFDLVTLLNGTQSHTRYKLVYLPRRRIERDLTEQTLDGVVLGVHPVWFKDPDKARYLWSEPLMYDTDEFVSCAGSPFEYDGASSMQNKKFGGILGYHYFRTVEPVKSGALERVNANSEEGLLELALRERVDFAIVSRSTLNYFIKKNRWQNHFYLSKQPHESYYRAILSPRQLQPQFERLSELLNDSALRIKLAQLMTSYQVEPVLP